MEKLNDNEASRITGGVKLKNTNADLIKSEYAWIKGSDGTFAAQVKIISFIEDYNGMGAHYEVEIYNDDGSHSTRYVEKGSVLNKKPIVQKYYYYK